jgi:hypothetical protein
MLAVVGGILLLNGSPLIDAIVLVKNALASSLVSASKIAWSLVWSLCKRRKPL